MEPWTVRVLAFVGLVALVYVVEGSWLARRWASRRWGSPMPAAGRVGRVLMLGCHGAAVAGLGCFAWGWLCEPYRLEVARETYDLAGSEAGRRLRIAHLSDLHVECLTRRERDLAARVNALDPDLIVITGDLLNHDSGRPVLRAILEELRAPLGKYLVYGNWDAYHYDPRPEVEAAGVVVLDRATAVLDTPVGRVLLAGLTFGGGGDLLGAFASAPGARRIVLCHMPDAVERAAEAGADFYFCGHTHGGQVCLPFYGALATFSRFDKKYEAGRYRVGNAWAYVSRGVGMEGGLAPRVRFWCRPEITLHELVVR